MRIEDLGLTNSLREGNVPLDTKLDMQMLSKIERQVALKQNIARRKNRLAAIFRKLNLA